MKEPIIRLDLIEYVDPIEYSVLITYTLREDGE